MSFVSYAQNFEDVMLWRALKHVEKGFYIDVGAWSPDMDSVTKAFYERGWRGINIEPEPEIFKNFHVRRREDMNLCVAIADYEGEREFYHIKNSGLSTLNQELAGEFASRGMDVRMFPVPVLTLNRVWEEHVGCRAVHFLKVDVEGFEECVIRGNDWQKHRPWIVMVEAMRPSSQIENFHTWEPIILQADYLFAYADGINRFYVAMEHAELLDAFKYPPNRFDHFKTVSLHECEIECKKFTTTVAGLKEQMKEHRDNALYCWTLADGLSRRLTAVHESWSWRITAPLRGLMGHMIAVMLVMQRGVRKIVHRFADFLYCPLVRVMKSVLHHPDLSNRLNLCLMHCPFLYQRLLNMAYHTGLILGATRESEGHQLQEALIESPSLDQLTPHARKIYYDLKSAAERRSLRNN